MNEKIKILKRTYIVKLYETKFSKCIDTLVGSLKCVGGESRRIKVVSRDGWMVHSILLRKYGKRKRLYYFFMTWCNILYATLRIAEYILGRDQILGSRDEWERHIVCMSNR